MHTRSSRFLNQRRGSDFWLIAPLLAMAMMFLALCGLQGVAAETPEPPEISRQTSPIMPESTVLGTSGKAASKPSAGNVNCLGLPPLSTTPHPPLPSRSTSRSYNAELAPFASSASFSADSSLLDEVGRLATPVPQAQIGSWKAQLHSGRATGLDAARLHLRLGEWALASDESPASALYHLRTAAHMAPVTSPQYGQAMYEIAVTHFREGAYRQAADEFKTLVHAPSKTHATGYSRSDCALFARHALACYGYHEERSKLRIPEPPRLDPNCGAAGIAVCLRALKLPYDQKTLLASTRVTGFGSNLQDLTNACTKLGGGRWVTGRVVSADEAGLRALPLPVVAYVERDHFVAVTRADRRGVTYVCSDCGEWPGGEVDLTWKQWRRLEPSHYLSIVRKNSLDDRLLTRALGTPMSHAARMAYARRGIQVASAGPLGSLGAVQRTAEYIIAGHVLMQSRAGFVFPAPSCGTLTYALHCPPHVKCTKVCLISNKGAGDKDPVNLATLEEEYTPEPDLVVYNPRGPSVVWRRVYNSLRSSGYNSSDYGNGWSNQYNVYVFRSFNSTTGVTTLSLNMANGAIVPFGAASAPTVASPLVRCAAQAGAPCVIDWGYDASLNSSYTGNYYFVVTWKDGTKWKIASNFTYTGSGSPPPTNKYALDRIENRTGQGININHVAAGPTYDRVIGTITDDANQVLLTVNRNYGYYQFGVSSVSDRYNRSVYYQSDGTARNSVTQVSQVVTTGSSSRPARYSFGYQYFVADGDGNTLPFLHTISVPSPTGNGVSTATINYDPTTLYVTSLVDANGNTYTLTVTDGTHTKVTLTNALSQVEYSYTGNFNNDMSDVSETDGTNNILRTKTYSDPNTAFKPSSVTDSQGRTASYTWDRYGNPLTSTSARGTVTTYTWDYTQFPLGRLTTVQEGTRPATTFTYYEPSGLVQTSTGPSPTGAGTVTTSFTYDALGNVLTAAGPGNNAAATITTTINYTSDGAYSQAAARGQALAATDSLGHTSHTRYDSQGRVTAVWDALGNETDITYNLVGQPVTTTLPATGQTGSGHGYSQNVYQYVGGPLVATRLFDESATQIRQVAHTYGLEGEMLATTGSTEPVTNTYDSLYRTKTLADGNGHVTTYSYNAAGYLASVTLPGGDTTQFASYDVAGHLLQKIDGRGVVTSYVYNDPAGALTGIQYPAHAARNAAFLYDGYGRLINRTDGTGSESYSYGDRNQLLIKTTTYTGLDPKAIGYSYYANGSRAGMTTPAGNFSYAYDTAGRLNGLTNPFGESSAWNYRDNNWLSGQMQGNGVVSAYTYNALGQTTDLRNALGTTTLSEFGGITHDGTGNRLSVTADLPAVSALSGTTGYSYDSKDELTGETSTRSGGYTFGFGYDAAGNPTTFKGAGKSYNAKNQLVSGSSYVYDGDGNPTTYAGTSLSFDENDKATAFGSTLTADYTIGGVRAWKQDSAGSRTYFLYDGATPVVELGGTGDVSAVNTFGAAGLVSRRSNSASVFYTFDERGNTTQRLNSSGGIITSHISDAFGATASSSPTSDPYDGYGAQSGYYTDHETGLVLCTFRYYDPVNGRWLNRDPIGHGGGVNLYAYCTNNPTNHADPSGLEGDAEPEPEPDSKECENASAMDGWIMWFRDWLNPPPPEVKPAPEEVLPGLEPVDPRNNKERGDEAHGKPFEDYIRDQYPDGKFNFPAPNGPGPDVVVPPNPGGTVPEGLDVPGWKFAELKPANSPGLGLRQIQNRFAQGYEGPGQLYTWTEAPGGGFSFAPHGPPVSAPAPPPVQPGLGL